MRPDANNPVSRIHLDGQLDWTDPGRVGAFYRTWRGRLGRAAEVLLDLRDVRHLDSKLIACLIAMRREVLRSGGQIRVEVSDAVRQWMVACRVNGFMGV